MHTVPPAPLSSHTTLRAMRLSALEGVAYALMVGFGETYFLADAVRLGATTLKQGSSRSRGSGRTAQNVLNGSAQLLGGLLGVALLRAAHGSYRAVFLASLLARLAIAALEPKLVPPPRKSRLIGRRALFLRMIGIRPHGGAVHRPIDDGEGDR